MVIRRLCAGVLVITLAGGCGVVGKGSRLERENRALKAENERLQDLSRRVSREALRVEMSTLERLSRMRRLSAAERAAYERARALLGFLDGDIPERLAEGRPGEGEAPATVVEDEAVLPAVDEIAGGAVENPEADGEGLAAGAGAADGSGAAEVNPEGLWRQVEQEQIVERDLAPGVEFVGEWEIQDGGAAE